MTERMEEELGVWDLDAIGGISWEVSRRLSSGRTKGATQVHYSTKPSGTTNE